MDSIVDAYFPFLDSIEEEVLDIEKLVFEEQAALINPTEPSIAEVRLGDGSDTVLDHTDQMDKNEDPADGAAKADYPPSSVGPKKTRFNIPDDYPLLRRIQRFFRKWVVLPSYVAEAVVVKRPIVHAPVSTVHRMARTRRLVTSLNRFLATKSEVVTQVRKRILTTTEWGLGTGTEYDLDIFIYMGDVQGTYILHWSLVEYSQGRTRFLQTIF